MDSAPIDPGCETHNIAEIVHGVSPNSPSDTVVDNSCERSVGYVCVEDGLSIEVESLTVPSGSLAPGNDIASPNELNNVVEPPLDDDDEINDLSGVIYDVLADITRVEQQSEITSVIDCIEAKCSEMLCSVKESLNSNGDDVRGLLQTEKESWLTTAKAMIDEQGAMFNARLTEIHVSLRDLHSQIEGVAMLLSKMSRCIRGGEKKRKHHE